MADDLGPARAGGRQALLLQVWLSPSFPVGAFAYSHGLERAVEAGLVTGRASLAAWMEDLLVYGSIRNDLILLAAAWRAASGAAWVEFDDIAELGAALQPSAERRLESVTQGGAFLDAVAAAWPSPASHRRDRRAMLPSRPEIAYPIALAAAAAAHDIALEPLLEAYATAFIGNLASAAIRLGQIGQTDAQRLIAGRLHAIGAAAEAARASGLEDLGAATWSADLCSLEHETQYTRLFRS